MEYLEACEHEVRFATGCALEKERGLKIRSLGLEHLARFSCSVIDIAKGADSAMTIGTNHYEGGIATAADVLGAITSTFEGIHVHESCSGPAFCSNPTVTLCGLGLRVGPEFSVAVAHRVVVERKIQVVY